LRRGSLVLRLLLVGAGATVLVGGSKTLRAQVIPPSNGAESRLFVPIVLSSFGLNNSFFTSELTLTNRGATPAALSFTYTSAFGGGEGTATLNLEAGRQRVIPDAISFLVGLGVPIPTTGNRGSLSRFSFRDLLRPRMQVSLSGPRLKRTADEPDSRMLASPQRRR